MAECTTFLGAPLPGSGRAAASLTTALLSRSDPLPPEPPPPQPPPPEPPTPIPEPVANPKVVQGIGLTGGRLDTDEGLGIAVMCSLFCDARIDQAEAHARGIDDRRGYWADAFASDGPWGSTIWALARAGVTQETAVMVEERAKKALQWIIKAGIASAIEVAAVAVESAFNPRIELTVRIRRPSASSPADQLLWENIYVL